MDSETLNMLPHLALQNEYIMEHIFGFLGLGEVKLCRLVGSIWRNVGNSILRRKSLVKFTSVCNHRSANTEVTEFRAKVTAILESYKAAGSKPGNTPFAAFQFVGEIPLSMMVHFTMQMESCIRELLICSWESDRENLAKWCFVVNSLIGRQLIKLSFTFSTKGTNTCNFTPDISSRIQDLNLNNCQIIVQKEVLLRLKRLILGPKNKFIDNGVTVEEFIVNSVFDVRETDFLHLDGKNMILDLALCRNAKPQRIVILKNVKVLNWDNCDWRVKQLRVYGVPLIGKTTMKIEEIDLISTSADFSQFIHSTTTKKIVCRYSTTISQNPFFFPNLTDLKLTDESIAALSHFSQNENILKLHLHNSSNIVLDVDIVNFPKKVQFLRLDNVNVEGNDICFLETLHLNEYQYGLPFIGFRRLSNKFRGKYLFIWQPKIWRSKLDNVLTFLKQSHSFEYILLGKFNCDTDSKYEEGDKPWVQPEWVDDLHHKFKRAEFSKFVNKESNYYVFQKQKGLAVDTNELEHNLDKFELNYDFKPIEKIILNVMNDA